MNPMKNSLALAVALLATTIAGCSASQKSSTPVDFGNAKLSVSTSTQQISNINHLTLTVSAGAVTGSNPAMSDIVVDLTKSAAQQNQWTGSISNIPAGTARLFKAAAYQAAGTAAADLIYYGETVATVTAGATATITLMLQEQTTVVGPTRFAPQITALTLSNSYVLPSTPVAIHVAAVSPDAMGGVLNYQWSALCDAGSGSFTPPAGTGASLDTVFLPPNVNATCQLSILVKETANTLNKNTPLSVTTYVTVVVNANFGRANITAFPNSFPIVTVLGDFRYNFFSDVTIMPVGQQGDFQFSAQDPDGDNVKYTLVSKCGTSLADAAIQPNLSQDYFWYFVPGTTTYVGKATLGDGTTFTTTGTTGVTPPSPYTSEWKPHFGGTTDGFTFSNPASDCIFTLTVNDLCTGGNCGAAGQGGAADGSLKVTTVAGVTITSGTTGIINATHPSKPTRAPVVEAVVTVNQDGPNATGVQTWDPQKIAYVDANLSYNLQAAADDRWEDAATAPTVAWSCNTGTPSAPVNTVGTYAFGAGVKNLTSTIVLTTGASVPPSGQCTATFTSTKSLLATVVTIKFQKKDPCNSLPTNSLCSTGNVCLTGQTCQGPVGQQSCQGGTAITCPVTDGQCQIAICDPALGCGIDNATKNNVSCNKDTNGCTVGDKCVSGSCTAGPAAVCNQPADAQCQSANGTCQSLSATTYQCNYVNLADATACNKDSNGCTQNDACLAGACTAGPAVVCNTPADSTCQAATGSCNSTGNNTFSCAYAPFAIGTACNKFGACVASSTCNGAGACSGGVPACAAGQSCNVTTPAPGPNCVPMVPVPQVARDLWITPPAGLAMDPSGNTYVASNLALNTPTAFGTVSLKSTGGNDIFAAKYDTAGNVVWAINIGDDDGVSPTNQTANGVAVNNTGRVGLIGKIAGAVTFGTSPTISSAGGVSYIAALDSTGARVWAKGFDLGTGGAFNRIHSSPADATGRFAVCGVTNKAGVNPLTGATYGGLQDAVIAVFDNAGNKLWAVQLNTVGNELCNAVAVDDSGNVFAAGQFDGATLPIGATTLTGPGTTLQKYMWLAKFDGSTGNVLAAVAFSGPSGTILPQVATVDASGNVFVGGNFSGSPVFGGTTLTAAGGDDGFVAKFSGTTLAPSVAPVRIGGSGTDLVKGLAITSYGDVLVTGTVNPSTTTFKAANGGFDTSGIAQLTVNGAAAPDQFVAKLNRSTLATEFASVYGDAGTQNGDAVVVNRFTTGASRDAVTIGGTLTGSSTYGAAGTVTAGNGLDVSLVFGNLQ
jgi:hypothetical protein